MQMAMFMLGESSGGNWKRELRFAVVWARRFIPTQNAEITHGDDGDRVAEERRKVGKRVFTQTMKVFKWRASCVGYREIALLSLATNQICEDSLSTRESIWKRLKCCCNQEPTTKGGDGKGNSNLNIPCERSNIKCFKDNILIGIIFVCWFPSFETIATHTQTNDAHAAAAAGVESLLFGRGIFTFCVLCIPLILYIIFFRSLNQIIRPHPSKWVAKKVTSQQ